MGQIGKRHSLSFEAEVVMATMGGDQTMAELASRVQVHPSRIHAWKRVLVEETQELFQDSLRQEKTNRALIAQSHQQIGQHTVE